MIEEMKISKFKVGRVLITPSAQSILDNQDIFAALGRH
jgi:hypothetical protein